MLRFISKYTTILVYVAPMLFLITLSIILASTVTVYTQTKRLNDHSHILTSSYNLISALQVERGMSAAYLSSNKTSISALDTPRSATDAALLGFQELIDLNAKLQSETMATYNSVAVSLKTLSNIRNQITEKSLNKAEVITFYKTQIDQLIETFSQLELMAHDDKLSHLLAVSKHLVLAQEAGGLQRSIISSAFNLNTISNSNKRSLLINSGLFKDHIKSAVLLSIDHPLDLLDGMHESNNTIQINDWVDLIFETGSAYNIDASIAFELMTQRLNRIIKQQEDIIQNIITTSDQITQYSLWMLLLKTILIVIVIASTIAINISLNLSKKQSQEFKRVTSKLVKNQDLTVEIQRISHDQLGEAAENMNQVINTFRKDINQFREFAEKLVVSSNQTSSAIKHTEQNLKAQQEDVMSISVASEQMSTNIRNVNQLMSDGANKVENVSKETKEGDTAVKQSVKNIENLAAEVKNLGSNIAALTNKVRGISGMVEMIQSIAEQTNLLALNAAIEAARAGENGRGFAVVADEVRNLAKRTHSATEDITGIVSELESEANQAMKVIEDGQNKSDHAIISASQITQVLNQVVQHMEEVVYITAEVSKATKEQTKATDDITNKVKQINGQASENATASAQIAASAVDQEKLASDIQELIKQYKIG